MTAEPIVFPQTRGCPYHPPAGYDPLREGPSLQRVQVGPTQYAWIVTSHEQTHTLLADPRVSVNPDNGDFPMPAARDAIRANRDRRRSMLFLDDPEHRRLRQMVIPDFSVRRFREVHQCLGQNLARIELELALSALFDRLPDLRLAIPADQVPVRPNAPIQAVLCLPGHVVRAGTQARFAGVVPTDVHRATMVGGTYAR